MVAKHCKEEVAASLKLLATTYVQTVRKLEKQLEETLLILCRELDIEETSWMEHLLSIDPADLQLTSISRRYLVQLPIDSRSRLTSKGNPASWGYTLLFRFFEVIARSRMLGDVSLVIAKRKPFSRARKTVWCYN